MPTERRPPWLSPNYPYLDPSIGDARYRLYDVFYNAGYDFGAVRLYSFGSYGHRTARANETYRPPSTIVASPTLGVAGSYGDPDAIVYAPDGFLPQESLTENDFSVTGGLKGDLAGWHWDISSTYGRDKDVIRTVNSANAQYFIDTHSTPTDFYDGTLRASQWTNTLDVGRDFDVGLTAQSPSISFSSISPVASNITAISATPRFSRRRGATISARRSRCAGQSAQASARRP